MKWFLVFLLSMFGLLFLGKGIELWTVLDQVDGNGIGISFLGIDIIDGVLKDRIPSYAFAFTIAAAIPILVAINITIKLNTQKEKKHPIV